MEKEGVVGASVLHKPVHGPQNILFCWLAHGVLLVIGKNDHILAFISKVFHEIGRHIPDIVDAAPELATLAEVVDAN